MADGGVRSWAGEAACGLGLTGTGLALALLARRMELFEDGVPGPGLTPLLLGVALAALGLGIAAAAVVRGAPRRITVFDRDSAIAVCLLFVAVMAFESVGYVPATFLFLLSSFVLIGRERWLPAILVAASATLLTWALFVKALGVPLPAGPISLPWTM